jgi:molecular chaperone GrpE
VTDSSRDTHRRAETVRESGPGEVPSAETPAETASEAAEVVEHDLEGQLAAAERRADEHLDDLRRLAAEFDNYRKRVAREQDRLVRHASERLVKELLPVLDALERALEAAEEHHEARLEEGVKLVHRALAEALRKEGLEEIETDGRFDPHVHEALLAQPSEAEEGSVIQVIQRGWRIGDRVLRPARVVVSAGAPPEAA